MQKKLAAAAVVFRCEGIVASHFFILFIPFPAPFQAHTFFPKTDKCRFFLTPHLL